MKKMKIITPFLLTLFLLLCPVMILNQENDIDYHQEQEVVLESQFELINVNQIARVTCYVDKGIMANGDYVYPGAVAFSDRSVNLNQNIYVEGFGEMYIADRTAKLVHEKYSVPTIDIWMTEKECKEFGMKYLSYVIN